MEPRSLLTGATSLLVGPRPMLTGATSRLLRSTPLLLGTASRQLSPTLFLATLGISSGGTSFPSDERRRPSGGRAFPSASARLPSEEARPSFVFPPSKQMETAPHPKMPGSRRVETGARQTSAAARPTRCFLIQMASHPTCEQVPDTRCFPPFFEASLRQLPSYSHRASQVSKIVTRSRGVSDGLRRSQIQRARFSLVGFSRPSTSFK